MGKRYVIKSIKMREGEIRKLTFNTYKFIL